MTKEPTPKNDWLREQRARRHEARQQEASAATPETEAAKEDRRKKRAVAMRALVSTVKPKKTRE